MHKMLTLESDELKKPVDRIQIHSCQPRTEIVKQHWNKKKKKRSYYSKKDLQVFYLQEQDEQFAGVSSHFTQCLTHTDSNK